MTSCATRLKESFHLLTRAALTVVSKLSEQLSEQLSELSSVSFLGIQFSGHAVS